MCITRTQYSKVTYIVFLCFLSHVEVDHGGYRVSVNEEHTLCVPTLGKVIQEGEILHQVLTVRTYTMLQL